MFTKKQDAKFQAEPSEIAQAALNPRGWVYRVCGTYGPTDRVPPEAIVGAWKVGDDGRIVGDFVPNPSFKERNR